MDGQVCDGPRSYTNMRSCRHVPGALHILREPCKAIRSNWLSVCVCPLDRAIRFTSMSIISHTSNTSIRNTPRHCEETQKPSRRSTSNRWASRQNTGSKFESSCAPGARKILNKIRSIRTLVILTTKREGGGSGEWNGKKPAGHEQRPQTPPTSSP